jgi:hypothetical protein
LFNYPQQITVPEKSFALRPLISTKWVKIALTVGNWIKRDQGAIFIKKGVLYNFLPGKIKK